MSVHPAADVPPAANVHLAADVLPEAVVQPGPDVMPEADVHPAPNVHPAYNVVQPAADIHTAAEFAADVLPEADVQPAADVQPEADVNIAANVLLEAVVQPGANVISGDHHFMDGDITSFTDIPGDTICMDFVEGMPTTLSASLDPFLDPISLDTDKVSSELLGNIYPDGNVKVDDDPVMSMEPSSMPALSGTKSGKLLYYVCFKILL
jgi:hypothetical protein